METCFFPIALAIGVPVFCPQKFQTPRGWDHEILEATYGESKVESGRQSGVRWWPVSL